MISDLIFKIQTVVQEILGEPLHIHAQDTCSELSRYVGYILLENILDIDAWIYKLEIPHDKVHDILITHNQDVWQAIDPTIWQFFPEEKTVLVATSNKKENLIKLIGKKYGTKNILESERLEVGDINQKGELLDTVKKIIKS